MCVVFVVLIAVFLMLSNLADSITVTNTNNSTSAIGDETSLIKLVAANNELEGKD